jgi:NAD(P)-dependent dehydrogenase (short-subunit alcohol dehydrogenase family)
LSAEKAAGVRKAHKALVKTFRRSAKFSMRPEEYSEAMDLDLKGKIALVTGSTAGIGFAIAKRFAVEGAEVILNGRTDERVRESIAKIDNEISGAKLRGVAVDLGTAQGCDKIVREAQRVDILVNNVGIFEPMPFEKITDQDWEKFFAVNVMSGVRLSRAYLPAMKERNWGRIVFVSSESGLQIPPEMIHYGTTKTAQLAIARGLAETCRSTSVTVNSVLPGPTASEGVTEFVSSLAAENKIGAKEFEKQFFKDARPTSILQRFIEPDEIANVVAFVCSPLASAINGAAVRADGGVVRSIG